MSILDEINNKRTEYHRWAFAQAGPFTAQQELMPNRVDIPANRLMEFCQAIPDDQVPSSEEICITYLGMKVSSSVTAGDIQVWRLERDK